MLKKFFIIGFLLVILVGTAFGAGPYDLPQRYEDVYGPYSDYVLDNRGVPVPANNARIITFEHKFLSFPYGSGKLSGLAKSIVQNWQREEKLRNYDIYMERVNAMNARVEARNTLINAENEKLIRRFEDLQNRINYVD